MKKIKDKAVRAGKESLSDYHYHKLDKRYDELIKQVREEKPLPEVTVKNGDTRKNGRFLPWWNALIITRYPSAFLSKTSSFRLIII